MSRRILAAVFSELPIALARRRVARGTTPLAVMLDPARAIVVAADADARKHGVKIGETTAAAMVHAAGLTILHVPRAELTSELDRIAEILSQFAPTAATRLSRPTPDEELSDTFFEDTAWLDVTGATLLAGGELELMRVIDARIAAIGHHARLALASGPRIARALARYGAAPVIAREGTEQRLLAALPLEALPLDARTRTFFRRMGLGTLRDVMRLPRAQVSSRLRDAPYARAVLDLLEGRDDTPLAAWSPAHTLVETQGFDDGVSGTEALTFVLRGMTSRLGLRLSARGEAVGRLVLTLTLDRSIARHEAGPDAPTTITIEVSLPVPLADPDALLRTLLPPLDRQALVAPVVVLALTAEDVVRARRDQLDLSRGRGIDPGRLPRLYAELLAEVGEGNVGLFRLVDAHRPELRARLSLDGVSLPLSIEERTVDHGLLPTRLLPAPVPLAHCAPGEPIVLDRHTYVVDRMVPLARLDGIEWWKTPVSRDYLRVSLVDPEDGERCDALVYRDRTLGGVFLHGWME